MLQHNFRNTCHVGSISLQIPHQRCSRLGALAAVLQATPPSGLAPPPAAHAQPCGGAGGGCPVPPPPMPYLKARALAVGPLAPADRDTCLARTPAGDQSTVGSDGAVRCVPDGWPYPNPRAPMTYPRSHARMKHPRSTHAVWVGYVAAQRPQTRTVC